MRPTTLTLLFLLLVSLAAPREATADDPQFDAAVRDLLKVTHAMALMDQIMEASSAQVWKGIKKVNPAIPDTYLEMTKEEFLTVFSQAKPELENAIIHIYAKHFTADEIRELLDFYRTPLGIKIIEHLPEIAAQSFAMGQQWGQRAGELASKRVIEKLRNEGYEL